jgi:hypothetical protein
MTSIVKWFLRGAEIVAATMMAAMFLTFILQIAIRYSAKLEWLAQAFPMLEPSRTAGRWNCAWRCGSGSCSGVRSLRGARARSCHLRCHLWPRQSQGAPLVRHHRWCRRLRGLLWSVEPTWSKFFILRLKKTATLNGLFGDWIRMRDIYSIYILFLVVVAARYGWRAISAVRHGADIDQHRTTTTGGETMTLQFALCLLTLFFLAGIGTPVAYSIIVSSFVYLTAVNGQGVGIAGKVLMDGLYQSFILLAVPLFIVAANIMNAGTISDRLLQFCVAAVGRFRGGLGHVNIVASLIFSGMSGSAVADAAGSARSSSA